MLLHLEQPYVAVLVCTGDTHEEPALLGFPDQKGKKLSEPDVEIALNAIAVEHGWRNGACPRCGVEDAKRALGIAEKAFEDTDDEAEGQAHMDRIEELQAYLGKYDPDRKKGQPDLPFNEQQGESQAEYDGPDGQRFPLGEDEGGKATSEPEEEAVGAPADDD